MSMTGEWLVEVASTGAMGAITAFALWRMREKDQEHTKAMERRDKLFAEAMQDQSASIYEVGKALERLGGFLDGRLK